MQDTELVMHVSDLKAGEALKPRASFRIGFSYGANDRNRTCDLLFTKQLLYL